MTAIRPRLDHAPTCVAPVEKADSDAQRRRQRAETITIRSMEAPEARCRAARGRVLIGTWNMSGTIPTMMYCGIQFIDPDWLYLATAVICGGIALAIGSSWTSAGTIGVGMVGLATMAGVSPIITAGAVIRDMAAVLGVPTLLYLPFCFFNIASPLLTVIYGFGAGRAVEEGGLIAAAGGQDDKAPGQS